MKYKIEISPSQNEDIIISAKEKTPLLEKIEELIASSGQTLLGYNGDDTVILNSEDISCFYVDATKVYAMTDKERWLIKSRLYQLEAAFSGRFIKINQSCLINPRKIERFNSSISGTLSVILKNGYKDYVSRRQLKEVKERMGL